MKELVASKTLLSPTEGPLFSRHGKDCSFLDVMGYAGEQIDDECLEATARATASETIVRQSLSLDATEDGTVFASLISNDSELPVREPHPHFGDIMPSFYPHTRNLSTFDPRERIVLTANGNLQRIISSYYNKPVSVKIVYNRPIQGKSGHFNRKVKMDVGGVAFATATSVVILSRPELIDAVENRGVAIGQLFRHFSILPAFHLLGCAIDDEGALQRTYLLEGAGISCKIHEEFVSELFYLKMGSNPGESVETTKAGSTNGHFGDIMAGNKTGFTLPSTFEPMQRVLLTANGNLERIVASFYCSSCSTTLASSEEVNEGVFHRITTTMLEDQTVMVGKWQVTLSDPKWIAAHKRGIDLDSMFQHFSVLPTFQLDNCGETSGYFWRSYSLSGTGMTCKVFETIDCGLCHTDQVSIEELSKITQH